MTWGYVAVGAGTLVGGYLAGQGAKSSANTQAGAAENAQQISQQEFNTITGQELPFMQGGYNSLQELETLLGTGQKGAGYGSLLQPYNYKGINVPQSNIKPFTVADWKRLSPAYNFQKQQGMQGVLNASAPNEGALSGAAQKDLMSFNQNLANTSFNNAFDMYQQQQQNQFGQNQSAFNMYQAQQGNLFNMYQTNLGNIYGRLSGLTQLGQNAAANTGQQGTALAGQEAQSATNVGTALAAGQVGQANAYSNMFGGLGGLGYLYTNQNANPPPTYNTLGTAANPGGPNA